MNLIPPSIRHALSGWLKPLPILLALLILVVISTGVLVLRPDKPVGDLVTASAPPVPEHDQDNSRGDGLTRGRSVGAEPSKAYPRPSSFLTDRGYKYAFVPSPNWSSRGAGDPIEAIVVHVTGSGTMAGMDSWFGQTVSQVSAHFGVDKACPGTVHQYVEIGDVAWHAGIVNKPNLSNPLIASWVQQGINPNRRTLGIEVLLEPGQLIGEYPCMASAFDDLLLNLLQTTKLPIDRVHIIGHNELDAVNRGLDPICCVALDLTTAYAYSRANPAPAPGPSPMQVTLDSINQRLQVVEQRLGITD